MFGGWGRRCLLLTGEEGTGHMSDDGLNPGALGGPAGGSDWNFWSLRYQ